MKANFLSNRSTKPCLRGSWRVISLAPEKVVENKNPKNLACFRSIADHKTCLTQNTAEHGTCLTQNNLQNKDLTNASGVSYAKKMLNQQDRYWCCIVISEQIWSMFRSNYVVQWVMSWNAKWAGYLMGIMVEKEQYLMFDSLVRKKSKIFRGENRKILFCKHRCPYNWKF